MITLIGVGHVFDLRAAIRNAIEERRPAVVGVELDPARLEALRAPEASQSGFTIYAVLAYVQRRIASEYGTRAGAEMLAAADTAREVGARLAFLDLDSRFVLGRLLRAMTWREKAKFAFSVLGGLFLRRSTVESELQKFESDEAAFLEALAKDFPAVKRVLIDERNAHMAGALRSLSSARVMSRDCEPSSRTGSRTSFACGTSGPPLFRATLPRRCRSTDEPSPPSPRTILKRARPLGSSCHPCRRGRRGMKRRSHGSASGFAGTTRPRASSSRPASLAASSGSCSGRRG